MQVDNIMKLREWACVRLSMINKEGRDGKVLMSSFAVFGDWGALGSMSTSILMLRWYVQKLNQLCSTSRCFRYQNILLLHPHPECVSRMAGAWHRPRDGGRLRGRETEDDIVLHTRVQEAGVGNMSWNVYQGQEQVANHHLKYYFIQFRSFTSKMKFVSSSSSCKFIFLLFVN